MASFQQHINIAVIATGIIIIPLHSAGMLDNTQAFIALGLGFIGGILPDLDSDHSKPTQIAFQLISMFFPLFIVLSYSEDLPLLYSIVIWLASSFVLHFTLFRLFLKATTHRGIFHTIPMGIFFGQTTVLISQNIIGTDKTFSSLAGFFIFFGFMIHLLLDELYSIDSRGMKMKKSFGTAFKFYYKKNIIGTFMLYALIFYTFTIIPLDKNIYYEIFEIFKGLKLI